MHNKAICEYTLSSYKNVNEFKEELDIISNTVCYLILIVF
jgi:hypothetical protein